MIATGGRHHQDESLEEAATTDRRVRKSVCIEMRTRPRTLSSGLSHGYGPIKRSRTNQVMENAWPTYGDVPGTRYIIPALNRSLYMVLRSEI
jgi:hypothetical protein